MGYSKESVEFHSDYGRSSMPAVNVKHWPDFERDVEWSEFEPVFKDWVMAELEKQDVYDTAWQVAAESCWDLVTNDAQEIFGQHVKVWSQGRSGGWAIVDGLANFECWDAIQLGKWRKFEEWAKQDAKGMAHEMVMFLYLNAWEVYRQAVSVAL